MPVAASDLDFRDAFEAGQVVPADFDHRAHLRLAYVYLSTLPDEEEAFLRMQGALLLDTKAMLTHYTEARLGSELARREWVPPDREPIPDPPPPSLSPPGESPRI